MEALFAMQMGLFFGRVSLGGALMPRLMRLAPQGFSTATARNRRFDEVNLSRGSMDSRERFV